jgi:hypothetical protein
MAKRYGRLSQKSANLVVFALLNAQLEPSHMTSQIMNIWGCPLSNVTSKPALLVVLASGFAQIAPSEWRGRNER